MKIVMYNVTTTLTVGGVETFVWEISRELARRGHDVDMIGGEGSSHREIPGVRVITRPFISRDRFLNLGTRFRRLMERLSFGYHCRRNLSTGGYDWIYIQKPYDLPVASWLKRRTGTRILLGLHGNDFFPGDRWFVRHVDAAVACSAYVRDEARRRYGIDPAVIYNGVDTDIFCPGLPDQTIREEVGVRPDDQVVVTVGRIIPGKGIEILLRALDRLHRSNLLLVVVGEGPDRGRLEALVKRLKLRAHFTGEVDHNKIIQYHRIAEAAVFPSLLKETFGIAVAEAMACGLPVIVSRTGAVPELVEEGWTGFLLPPGDEKALARQLETVLSDREGSRKIGVSAREIVIKNFSWRAVGDRLEAVLAGGDDSDIRSARDERGLCGGFE